MLTSKSGDACACASVRSIRKSGRLERDPIVFNGPTYDLWSTNHGAVLLKNAFVNDESSVRGVSVVPFRRLGARLPDLSCHCDQTSERYDGNLHALLDSKIKCHGRRQRCSHAFQIEGLRKVSSRTLGSRELRTRYQGSLVWRAQGPCGHLQSETVHCGYDGLRADKRTRNYGHHCEIGLLPVLMW